MEEERTHKEIELRSEEVQEVMGRIPPFPLWFRTPVRETPATG